MAKKRKNRQVATKMTEEQVAVTPSVPKFELGVKGDEFDLKFTRAVAEKTSKADSLLRSLSRETRVSGFNLLNFAVIVIVMLMLSLSFALLSRSDDAPKLTAAAFFDGSYTAELTEYYSRTLPFGRALRTLGAYLGFCEMPAPLPNDEIPEDIIPDEPVVTEQTDLPVTTAPTTATVPTSAPITEQQVTEPPETHTMYAKATANVRLLPDNDSMIMGYFSVNEEVEVINLRSDGWATIWYNDMVAYVSSDLLGETTTATTRRKRSTTTEEIEEVITEEITTVPEETEPETTVPEETEPEETTSATTVYTGPYYVPPTPPPQTAPTTPETAPEPETTPEPVTTPEPQPSVPEPEPTVPQPEPPVESE